MLLSKKPFTGKIHWSKAEIPFIEAKFKTHTTWLVHPLPPMSQQGFFSRNMTIQELSNSIDKNKTNIVCGDFNAVPWSPIITHLKSKASLKNTSEGFGVKHTWPAHLPLPGITIDYCFISEDASIHNFTKGPYLGSDHFPLVIEYSLPQH